MGVYIKEMNMPEGCAYCEVPNIAYCDLWIFQEKKDGNVRHPDCPLIEVKKPHGRFIDADKQFKELQKQVMALYSEKSDKYSYLMDVLDSINREPTVIEAEK